MKFAMLVAITAGLGAAGGAANATVNLVQNAGFEQTTDGNLGSHEFGASNPTYGQDVSDWTSPTSTAYNILFTPSDTTGPANVDSRYTAPGQHLWALPPSSDPDGGNFIGLVGASTYLCCQGPLQQTIDGLQAGKSYTLSFYWATGQIASRTGPTWEQIQYSLGGDTFTTALVANPSQGSTGWYQVTQTFTATSTSELLSFLSQGAPGNLPSVALLDGVSLTSNAPEPATWALMLIGFGGVGAAVRSGRRRRRAAAS